jgi:hypothetical protein
VPGDEDNVMGATLDRWRPFLEAPKTIPLVHVELRGRDATPPLLAGTGEIRMNSLQDFSYGMTTTAGDPFAFLHALEHYRQNTYDGTARLRLFGRDAEGTEWSGGFTVPQKISFGSWSIEGTLTALIVNEQLSTVTESTELVFYTNHLHPLVRVMARQKQKRLEILGSVIEFTYENSNNVVSITASHSSQLPAPYTERWLSEPLRIMFGQPVQPRLLARNIGRKAIVFILAVPRLEVASWSAFWTDEGSSADDFFERYSQLLTMVALPGGESRPVTRFYDELAQVARASHWVMALTLAGCTEGLASLLRPRMSASEFQDEVKWSEGADSLAEKIEKLEGPSTHFS